MNPLCLNWIRAGIHLKPGLALLLHSHNQWRPFGKWMLLKYPAAGVNSLEICGASNALCT